MRGGPYGNVRLHVGANTKKKTLKQRFKVFFFGGAFSTALEPLCRYFITAFRAFQVKKRRNISAFQPLLMGFFELILMQGNSFCEEPVFFGSAWIIHMEAFTNSVKLVE